MQGAEIEADGTILLGGHTEGLWSTANAGGRDFALVKLNQHGDPMWRWQVDNGDEPANRLICHGSSVVAACLRLSITGSRFRGSRCHETCRV